MKIEFIGKKIEDINLLDLFFPSDGEINLYYGRIGQGKTYAGTADAYNDLMRGEIVYTNWPMNFEGVDQRNEWPFILGGLFFPWKNKYFKFPRENWHYLPINEHFLDKFEKITGAKVYLDEGHVPFDSYEMAKMSMNKRIAVLHTRHFDRSINIITQRPTAVHVTVRANVNRFFKCEKMLQFKDFIIFRKTEYQDMTGETVNEEEAISTELYIGRNKIFNLYNSKYLRGEVADSQSLNVYGYKLNYWNKIQLLWQKLFPSKVDF